VATVGVDLRSEDAPRRAQRAQRGRFIISHEPRVASRIRSENCGKLALWAHRIHLSTLPMHRWDLTVQDTLQSVPVKPDLEIKSVTPSAIDQSVNPVLRLKLAEGLKARRLGRGPSAARESGAI
jgi:hypothetical protein